MSLYGTVNRAYRRLPEPARRWTLEHAPAPVLDLRQRIVTRLERGAPKEELYDGHYYDHIVDPLMRSSAEAISASIQREFVPRSIIDVGCGSGALMVALERRGVACLGFDQASAALERCRERRLSVRRLDIERDAIPPERADVALSTEVAEHLQASAANRFVELLTTLAPIAVLSAAPPGSSGKDHVNEQPNEYWIAKFAGRSFTYDRDLALRLREEWRVGGVDEAFYQSLMLFRANG